MPRFSQIEYLVYDANNKLIDTYYGVHKVYSMEERPDMKLISYNNQIIRFHRQIK